MVHGMSGFSQLHVVLMRVRNISHSYVMITMGVCCDLQALRALGCMEHRGACSADDDSGDGAGLMTQIPWKLLQKEMPEISETNTG